MHENRVQGFEGPRIQVKGFIRFLKIIRLKGTFLLCWPFAGNEHPTSNIEVEIAIGIEFQRDRIGSGYNEINSQIYREAVTSSLLVVNGLVFDSDPDSDSDLDSDCLPKE